MRQSDDHGNVLGEQVAVDLLGVDCFVRYLHTVFVFRRSITEVEIQESRDQYQQDKEGSAQYWNLVLSLKKETRQCNGDVVAARAVGVAILLEVFVCGLIGQDLCKTKGGT